MKRKLPAFLAAGVSLASWYLFFLFFLVLVFFFVFLIFLVFFFLVVLVSCLMHMASGHWSCSLPCHAHGLHQHAFSDRPAAATAPLHQVTDLNISLDTLVPAKFEFITRRKGCQKVTHCTYTPPPPRPAAAAAAAAAAVAAAAAAAAAAAPAPAPAPAPALAPPPPSPPPPPPPKARGFSVFISSSHAVGIAGR